MVVIQEANTIQLDSEKSLFLLPTEKKLTIKLREKTWTEGDFVEKQAKWF